MDFKELLSKADFNAKKQNKKVREADQEIEFEKRKNLERLAIQKRLEKEDIKRKAPPRPLSPEKPKFTIPKKQIKNDVDKSKIALFLKRQEIEKQQKLLEKEQEKEKLIKLRLEANGGKANKKISKHFGKTPIELQMRYAHNFQHEEQLRKQQEREEEEHEKLSALYRQGVYKAINKKDPIQTHLKNNQSIKRQDSFVSKTNKTENVSKNLKVSADSMHSKSQKQEIRKRKSSHETTNFLSLMQEAEQNRNINSNHINYEVEFKRPAEKASKINDRSDFQRERGNFDKKKTSSFSKNIENEKKSIKSGISAPSFSSSSLSKLSKPIKNIPESSSKISNNNVKNQLTSNKPIERNKIVIVEHPEDGICKEKRYLPGDIRYKGQPQSLTKNIEQKKEKRFLPGDVRYSGNSDDKSVKTNKKTQIKQESNNIKRSYDDSRPSSSIKNLTLDNKTVDRKNSSSFNKSSIENTRNELERRKRELKLLEREYEQKRLHEEKRKNEISLDKIKNMQQMRYNMNRANKSSHYYEEKKTNRYTNYSETDEEQDEMIDDEEYDSDMADFIDDTVVDDLQREDFEESLRIINPRYDKNKWKIRERMIDDRRMDSRFRDIEVEERHSAKLGFYEDLKEARRGSKALG